MREADRALTVWDRVEDRNGHPRWLVCAVFVDINGSEPRCIDYRVRVIPRMPSKRAAEWAARQVEKELQADVEQRERQEVYMLAEVTAPAEGIPRRIFEQASQTRLLAKARTKIKAPPGMVGPEFEAMLDRQAKPRRGRPPVHPLGEKLGILVDVEHAYAKGETLQDVADAHHMSRSAVRDLVAWARSGDSGHVLFTKWPGRRGGELTQAARRLLEERTD
jgi:hypothetical protein